MFNKKFNIITIGSATRDVLIKSKDFNLAASSKSETGEMGCFPFGAKIDINEIAFTTGGGGTNTAVTFARQGFDVATIAAVGKDSVAQEIISELKKEGVNTDFFQTHDDDFSAFSAILVHDSGERTILNYKGEAQHLSAEKINFGKIKTDWFYITSLGGNLDLLEKIADFSEKNKIKVAINLGVKDLELGVEKLNKILKVAKVAIFNEEEGRRLVGGESKRDILSNLRQAINDAILVLTDGSNGVLVDDKIKKYSAGVPDSPVIERTGAGDAFGSGFVAEFIRQMSDPSVDSGQAIKKAIQLGTANASSVVTKFGAKAGILKKDDWGQWPLVDVNEF